MYAWMMIRVASWKLGTNSGGIKETKLRHLKKFLFCVWCITTIHRFMIRWFGMEFWKVALKLTIRSWLAFVVQVFSIETIVFCITSVAIHFQIWVKFLHERKFMNLSTKRPNDLYFSEILTVRVRWILQSTHLTCNLSNFFSRNWYFCKMEWNQAI